MLSLPDLVAFLVCLECVYVLSVVHLMDNLCAVDNCEDWNGRGNAADAEQDLPCDVRDNLHKNDLNL